MNYIAAPLLLLALAYPANCLAQAAPTTDADTLKALVKKVEALEEQNLKYSANLKELFVARDNESKNRYLSLKGNLVASIDLFKALNTRLNTLEAQAKSDAVGAFITELGHPTNEVLGFNLQSIIKAEVEKLNVGPIQGPRLLKNINTILQSPLVSSIPSVAPAVSIINSAVNLIRSVAFVDKTDPAKIEAFEKEINKYVKYYLALSDGRAGFSYDLKIQMDEVALLHQKLKDQVTLEAKVLGYAVPEQGAKESTGTYLNKFLSGFSASYIEKTAKKLESEHTTGGSVNYGALLATEDNPLILANSHVQDALVLADQFEARFDSYKDIHQIYGTKVLAALNIALANNIGVKATVESKKQEFETLQIQAEEALGTAVDMNGLLESRRSVKVLTNFF